ncbi:alpha/beta fold hydrolase [Paraburkholderia rhizosphaerae]|uniref:Pimeloyl-ACP methyl ester carboxylesterase n=1 Tax=Paraburkholderia rhizosphaerae TaxID=480658 RepID=A0A4R8LXM7_9BURK|nr:alpha/beta hydrolase [Paraburkholderia rhizosphaerae]TDY51446.1 pimeloyl-ACP methyl ester carboxylesterase [Paraburkholderia rhizosphaerae]
MTATIEGFVSVAGQQVAFTRTAETPTVALLHGIPTNRHLWRAVTPALSARQCGWIAFDLVGYGESSKPESIDIGVHAQAGFIADALHQSGWQGGTIIGHDIGGGVAQLLALDATLSVSRLGLVDSVAYDSFPEPGIARLKDPIWDAILGAADFDLQRGFAKGLRQGVVKAERVTPQLVAEYERPFAGVAGRAAYLRAARALRSEDLEARSADIEALKIPVLLVWGAQDRFQPLKYGQRLADALQNARLEVVDTAGHFLPEDEPELLGKMLADFALDTR